MWKTIKISCLKCTHNLTPSWPYHNHRILKYSEKKTYQQKAISIMQTCTNSPFINQFINMFQCVSVLHNKWLWENATVEVNELYKILHITINEDWTRLIFFSIMPCDTLKMRQSSRQNQIQGWSGTWSSSSYKANSNSYPRTHTALCNILNTLIQPEAVTKLSPPSGRLAWLCACRRSKIRFAFTPWTYCSAARNTC